MAFKKLLKLTPMGCGVSSCAGSTWYGLCLHAEAREGLWGEFMCWKRMVRDAFTRWKYMVRGMSWIYEKNSYTVLTNQIKCTTVEAI